MVKKNKYDADSITVLEFPNTIKKNVGMYVGDSEARGCFQCVYEIISNSIDEFLAGHCTKIYVKADLENNSLLICDNGRGMPVGKHKKTKDSTLYLLVGSVHAGGKIDSGAYSSSGGKHGTGSAAANALSDFFEVTTFRDKKWHYIDYVEGHLKTKIKKIKKPLLEHKEFKRGTQIRLAPSNKIFKKGSHKLDLERISDALDDLSYLCPGLTIYWHDGKDETTFEQSEGGHAFVRDWVEGDEDQTLHKKIYHYMSDTLDVALQWTTDDEEDWAAYTNCIFNESNGKHVDGVASVIDKAFENVYGKVKGSVLRQGLRGFVSIKLNFRPEFVGQTKDTLSSPEAKTLIIETISKDFENWLRNNNFTRKIWQYAQGRLKASKAMSVELEKQLKELDSEIKESNKRKHTVCAKLIDAYGCKPQDKELFLVEGDSAKGGLLPARDADYQAILILKGKFSNVYKADKKVFSNEDIKNIFTSLGVTPNQKDMLKKLKAGKIIIATDADVDGFHISDLIIGLFNKYLPEIISAGLLYKSVPPLFAITDSKGNKTYAITEKERDKHLKKIKGNPVVTRFKGLGEANGEVMRDCVMNPATRTLIQLIHKKDSDVIVEKTMGEDTLFRKEILGIKDRILLEE